MLAKITIPPGVRFADLNLARAPGGIAFDWAPIEAICEASGIDIALFRDQHEDNVAGLIVAWYMQARRDGEPADHTADSLILEATSELN